KQEYEKEKAEVISRLCDEPTLALISDGWTNTSKQKIVNYVLVSPLMWPLLWCTKLIGEDEQTAENVAEAIGAVIDDVNEAVGSPMKKKKEEHRRALRLTVPTRWYSSYECIKSIVDNRSTIIDLFKKTKFLKKRFGRSPAKLNEARDIVENKAFWSRTRLVASLMEPFVDAIAVLERGSCCVSMVYWQFSQLRREPIFNQRHSSIPVITKKTADFVDADLAAAVESVKVIAVRLKVVTTPAETEQIGNEACAFYPKKDCWSSQTRARQGGLSPIAWWSDKVNRTSTDDDYYPLLAPLAVKIYTMPTSSAASERSTSILYTIDESQRDDEDEDEDEEMDEESGESSDSSGNADGYDSNAFSYDGNEEQKSKI
ncbi:hypothetical protein PHMEG_0003286, partial [Phytophthora megakarya]